MSLLNKLWDDVLAGPQPDKGLGRLRGKPRTSADMNADSLGESNRGVGGGRNEEYIGNRGDPNRVSQSIAIAKPPQLLINSADWEPVSCPSTPGASTPSYDRSPTGFDAERYPKAASLPSSPALGSPAARERENLWTTVFHPGGNKIMKKLGSEKFDKQAPNTPTVYDWVVLSALDR
ncbi:hypothetical protein KP509_02G019800 [Ceratopteris richardii]|uniref:Uncharacterized protein n=1 Tax=Ceratopteris richardii TaxID=49495 RepID=A0A8T2V7R3_CERRI|nr:hypothetical protein KP509_02G019800 [Ceratopteris richardii]